MSIRKRASKSPISRRQLVAGSAAGAAIAAMGGSGRLTALAQDATPAATQAAGACAEPFDAELLSTVTMVTDDAGVTVAIVPKGG